MRNKLTYTLLCLLVCLICIPAKAQVSFGKAGKFLYILCNIFKISTIQNPYCF